MSSLDLLRIERKLDLILNSLAAQDPVLRELIEQGDVGLGDIDLCPLCRQKNRISADFENETYSRSCGCVPAVGRVVRGIGALTRRPPAAPSKSVHINPPPEDAAPEPDPGEPSTTSSAPRR